MSVTPGSSTINPKPYIYILVVRCVKVRYRKTFFKRLDKLYCRLSLPLVRCSHVVPQVKLNTLPVPSPGYACIKHSSRQGLERCNLGHPTKVWGDKKPKKSALK